MNGMEQIVLFMAQKMNGERSLAGCYHILTGKKSSQAIQDASLYGFTSWFGLFAEWPRTSFEEMIASLVASGQLQDNKENHTLTPQAEEKLMDELESYSFFKRAFLLQDTSLSVQEIELFSKKFHLLSQVLSHWLYHHKSYYPIIHDLNIQLEFKHFWLALEDKQGFAECFVREIHTFLEELKDDLLANLLVDRLSGYQLNGRTFQQMAASYDVPEAVLRIFYVQVMGYLLQWIYEKRSSIWSQMGFLRKGYTSSNLTLSAQSTYHFLRKGLDLEEISHKRKLKLSTIEDHCIEIALHVSDVDFSPYVSEELVREVEQVSRQMQTKKLRILKDRFGERLSYFQLRLALVLAQNRLKER